MLVTAAGQAAMVRPKRHSRVEVAKKLAQANGLARQGKLQSEIARTLGVSVVTLHRWRKAQPGPQRGFVAIHGAGQPGVCSLWAQPTWIAPGTRGRPQLSVNFHLGR